jgi:transposase
MRKVYPSDISREQFKEIEPILTEIRKQTKPREIDLYDVFCGILYVVKSCCQWRMLPSDFPKWQTVYSYFRMWKTQENGSISVLEVVLKKIGRKRTYEEWKKWQDFFCNNRRSEC